MKKFSAELFGTFALVFAGTGAIVINERRVGGSVTHVGIALTFGLIVLAMIYALGDVSRRASQSGGDARILCGTAFACGFSVFWPYVLAQIDRRDSRQRRAAVALSGTRQSRCDVAERLGRAVVRARNDFDRYALSFVILNVSTLV